MRGAPEFMRSHIGLKSGEEDKEKFRESQGRATELIYIGNCCKPNFYCFISSFMVLLPVNRKLYFVSSRLWAEHRSMNFEIIGKKKFKIKRYIE